MVGALLWAVAAAHFYRVRTEELSPWRGGGFAMFSTLERPSSRLVRIYTITHDGDVQDVDAMRIGLAPLIFRLQANPTVERLADLHQATIRTLGNRGVGLDSSSSQVVAEVWNMEHARGHLAVTGTMLLSTTNKRQAAE